MAGCKITGEAIRNALHQFITQGKFFYSPEFKKQAEYKVFGIKREYFDVKDVTPKNRVNTQLKLEIKTKLKYANQNGPNFHVKNVAANIAKDLQMRFNAGHYDIMVEHYQDTHILTFKFSDDVKENIEQKKQEEFNTFDEATQKSIELDNKAEPESAVNLADELDFLKERKTEILEKIKGLEGTNVLGDVLVPSMEIFMDGSQEQLAEMDNLYNELSSINSQIDFLEHKNREFDDDVFYAPPVQTPQQANAQRPITDNFDDMVAYYKENLKQTNYLINQLKRELKRPGANKTDVAKKLARAEKYKTTLQKNIDEVSTHSAVSAFSAIDSELDDIRQTISDGVIDTTIKDRLDFLSMLLRGVSQFTNKKYDVESLKNISAGMVKNLSDKLAIAISDYTDNIDKMAMAILEDDISYQNHVVQNDNYTDEQKEEIIGNLFKTEGDINYLEQQFLGVSNSGSKESVLMETLKNLVETFKVENDAAVKKHKDAIIEAAEKVKDTDFIFEKDENGARTGNILNFVTPLFRSFAAGYKAIEKKVLKVTPDATSADIYKEKINWLKDNVDIIDITKLPAIKQAFGNLYPLFFNHSDADMAQYEIEIKDKLGKLYDSEINKILDKISQFEAIRNEFGKDTPEVVKANPFQFTKNYFSPDAHYGTAYADPTTGNITNVLHDISLENLSFIPRTEKVAWNPQTKMYETVSSGYISEEFKDMMQDDNKFQYWEAISSAYNQQINPIYGGDYVSEMSFAKIEEGFMELIGQAKGIDKLLMSFGYVKDSFIDWFYEDAKNYDGNNIRRNYADSSRKEIRELSMALQTVSDNELYKMAHDLGINPSKTSSKKELATSVAREKIISGYSKDINKTTIALLNMSAMHAARQQVLPLAQSILESHKRNLDDKGKVRQKSIDKMSNYIERVIMNKPVTESGKNTLLDTKVDPVGKATKLLNKLPGGGIFNSIIDKEFAKKYSDSEKEIMDLLIKAKETGSFKNPGKFSHGGVEIEVEMVAGNKHFYKTEENKTVEITEQEYEEEFNKIVDAKIKDMGIAMNAAGVAQGFMKIIISKSLALNPAGGAINRAEGKHTNMIMDETGNYWTPGNIAKASNFLWGINFTKFIPERFTDEQKGRLAEFKKLRLLIQSMDIIQDKKNEIDKNLGSSKITTEEMVNWYALAVDHPEFKNKSEILLAILQDTKIKDKNGVEHQFFDGNKFTAYDIKDGRLVLKDEFRTDENILNWENFSVDRNNLKNNEYFLARNKTKNAISRSQGNYEATDTIMITNHILGKLAFLFKRWLPEHFMQRFGLGKNFSVTTGKQQARGRYWYLFDNTGASSAAILGTIGFAWGLAPSVALGAGFLGGLVAIKALSRIYNKQSTQQEANNVLSFIDFTRSVVLSTLNYPLDLFSVNPKYRLNSQVNADRINITEEEARNLSAVAKEFAIMLNILAMKALATALLWDDEDEEAKMRARYADNQLTKLINSSTAYYNPKNLYEDATRISFLQYLNDSYNVVKAIATQNGEVTQNLLNITPIPRALTKETGMFEDKRDYTPGEFTDDLGRDWATGGNHSAKKELKARRDELKEKYNAEFEEQGLEGKERDEAVKKAVREELPNKPKGMSYAEYIELLDNPDKLDNLD